jgi:hypothetical protein
LLLFMVPNAQAITVQIEVQQWPHCVYATGSLNAAVTGGVGPYTYLWSTGATTPNIYEVPAGTYSVTVTDFNGDPATDVIELSAEPLYGAEPIWLTGCPDQASGPPWRLVIRDYVENIGMGPYSFSGSVWDATELVTQNTGTYLYFSGFAQATPGTPLNATITDSNGCVSSMTGTFPPPPQWLQPQVLEVNGACSDGANGSIRVFVPEEPNGWAFGFELYRAGFSNPMEWTGGGTPNNLAGTSDRTFTRAGLPAGTYYLVTRVDWESFYVGTLQQEYFNFPMDPCTDTIVVEVPDLGYTCGTLSGIAYIDGNQNCIRNGTEPYLPNTVIEVQPGDFYAITNGAGQYALNLPYGTYTSTDQNALFQEHCGGEGTPFELSSTAINVVRNFADTSLVGLDMEAWISSTPARPGFELHYGISARNLTGASSGSGTVTFTFDPLLTFLGASQVPASVSGNTITWNFSSLNAFQYRYFSPRFQVPPDINLLGTVLPASATVTTGTADSDLANNTFLYDVTVTGAYDPNDKLVSTTAGVEGVYLIGEDDRLNYTIRFQNTGTDTAFFVVVTDTLPETLDPATFQLGVASHGMSLSLQESRVLRFMFPNIMLPDSNVNEALSHGFVTFSIKPRQPLLPGTEITNIANIYFDYNDPVITEPSTLVAEFSTGISSVNPEALRVWPNPANDLVRIAMNEPMVTIELVSMDGRVVQRFTEPGNEVLIATERYAPGCYLLSATTLNGRVGRTSLTIQR